MSAEDRMSNDDGLIKIFCVPAHVKGALLDDGSSSEPRTMACHVCQTPGQQEKEMILVVANSSPSDYSYIAKKCRIEKCWERHGGENEIVTVPIEP